MNALGRDLKIGEIVKVKKTTKKHKRCRTIKVACYRGFGMYRDTRKTGIIGKIVKTNKEIQFSGNTIKH